MEKIAIKNRDGKNIVAMVEGAESTQGLVFIVHGLGGYKEQKQLRSVAECFFEFKYTVVTYDARNTFGESEGKLEDATVTNYIEDLEDVISWSSTQSWYKEPFVLVGHSLGGIAVSIYASRNPQKVKALAPMSTVVSGKLSIENNPERVNKWKNSGYEYKQSNSRPWLEAHIPWSHMEDRLKYDLCIDAKHIHIPTLLVVGSADDVTPPKHQQLLYEALGTEQKEIHIIDGAPHTYKDVDHLQKLKGIFNTWITKI